MRRNGRFRKTGRKFGQGKSLCKMGWGLFAVSMFLPAAMGMWWIPGWECARFVLENLIELLKGGSEQGIWYYSGFALANLVMLASPFLVRRSLRERKWRWPVSMLLSSALLISSYILVNEVPLGIGYYAWITSFWLVTAGVLKLRAESLRKAKVETPYTPPLPLTPEEMAAERELKDYLRGIVH